MKRICLFALAAVLAFGWLRPVPVRAEEREVLTIGDVSDHSGDRLTGEDQLGMWQYLEDQIGMEIEYIYVSQDDYKSMMNSGNLPDILVTNNNLSEIREKGLALNIEPYLICAKPAQGRCWFGISGDQRDQSRRRRILVYSSADRSQR